MEKNVNKSSLWAYFVLSLITLLTTACNKDDDYTPIVASAQSRGLLVSCLDKDGKNLLADKAFVKGISAYGYESKKKISCQVKEVQGKSYISFAADLPDERKMQFSDNKKQATGMTQIRLKVNNQEIILKCFFKYTNSFKAPMLGGTSIVIEKVTFGQRSVKRASTTEISGDLVIRLQMDKNGKLQ